MVVLPREVGATGEENEEDAASIPSQSTSNKSDTSQTPPRAEKGIHTTRAATSSKKTTQQESKVTSPKQPSSETDRSPEPSNTNRKHSEATATHRLSPKSPKSPKSSKSSSSRRHTTPGKRSTKSKQKRKSIAFKTKVKVESIPNLGTYSREERANTWFQPEEYMQMEHECDSTSECMEKQKPLPLGYCARGLEAWTDLGEQMKERNVQLAVDIVWNAQLEQWEASRNTHECWEFIRGLYLPISQACQRRAYQIGKADEQEIQTYLASVRSVERNRRRMMRSRGKERKGGRTIRRTVSETTPRGPRRRIGRHHSTNSPTNKGGGILKNSPKGGGILISPTPSSKISSLTEESTMSESLMSRSTLDSEKRKKSKGRKVKHQQQTAEEPSKSQDSKPSRKVEFKPRSKTKVPLSPVGSVCSTIDSGAGSTASSRLRASHMSVCSDDSTRRRMLRTASIKNLSL